MALVFVFLALAGTSYVGGYQAIQAEIADRILALTEAFPEARLRAVAADPSRAAKFDDLFETACGRPGVSIDCLALKRSGVATTWRAVRLREPPIGFIERLERAANGDVE